jgi:hypothetical protein
LRALTGAKLLLGIPIEPLNVFGAAIMVRSFPQHVAAMKILIEANAWDLVDAVHNGRLPIIEAALLTADRDRAASGKFARPDTDWDETQAREVRDHRNLRDAFRAFIGAKLLLGIPIEPRTVFGAAIMVGSSPQHVAAMKILIEANAWDLVDAVLADEVPIIEAADSMRTRAKLFTAYRESDIRDRAALGKFVGPDTVFLMTCSSRTFADRTCYSALAGPTPAASPLQGSPSCPMLSKTRSAALSTGTPCGARTTLCRWSPRSSMTS